MKSREKNCPKKATAEERYLAVDAGISVNYLRRVRKHGGAPVSLADRLCRLTGQPIEDFIYGPGNHTAESSGAAATAPLK